MVSVIHTAKAGARISSNDETYESLTNEQEHGDEIPENLLLRHPLGVRPGGNALTAEHDLSRSMGVFGRIPDSLLLLLLEFLDQDALRRLSYTCKGLFAFATQDQLWRDLALRDIEDDFSWRGSWRSSVLKCSLKLPKVDCQTLYSDALYRPFQCTHTSLLPFTSNIPPCNQISRLPNLSIEDFGAGWSDKPFILTKSVTEWRVYRDWDEIQLLQKYGTTKFRAEAVDWTLNEYIGYMNNNHDESPLYLFDRAFVQKMQLQVGSDGAYKPPECFSEDLFTLLGDQRPDHRWLIVGPARSGSTFHKDPNATSAWNAVIRGSKYWIMFPNSVTPPGVFVSEDQSEVTSPLSIAEWLLTFHAEARQMAGCVEGICGAGEVLHVPSGWWHLVVNLEPAIAITQNFVPKAHLMSAVNFLKNKPDQVSGFRRTVENPYALFMDRLQEQHPDLYEIARARDQNKRKWEDVVEARDEDGAGRGGFSFGFNEDLEEEE